MNITRRLHTNNNKKDERTAQKRARNNGDTNKNNVFDLLF